MSAPLTLSHFHEIAEKNGGVCESTEYVNIKTKLLFKCGNGHEFQKTADSVRQGAWCPECSKDTRGKSIRRYTIKTARDIAKNNGGVCLTLVGAPDSTSITTEATKLDMACSSNHTWTTTLSVLQRGSWCRKCQNANWQVKYTANDLLSKITALEGSLLGSPPNPLKTKSTVTVSCAHGHAWETSVGQIFRGFWCQRCASAASALSRKLTIGDVREGVKSRGLCLSFPDADDDFHLPGGIYTRLQFRCKSDHEWISSPSMTMRSKRPAWCDICSTLEADYKRRKNTLGDVRAVVARHGGRLISNQGESDDARINSHHRGIFRCLSGHEWDTEYKTILKGCWCKQCAYDERRLGKNSNKPAGGFSGGAPDRSRARMLVRNASNLLKEIGRQTESGNSVED